ncbi:MAG TPA: cupin domain-containing protein, partial [Gaiellaceae bacterium]|nr:cupin domain-containing protein [Gaiellaceae bacterium]
RLAAAPRLSAPRRRDTPAMQTLNLFESRTDTPPDGTEPPGYEKTRAVRVGQKIGATRMGMSIYELDPGQGVCPYHFEWTDEEWLIVVSGSPTVRTPEGETVLGPGDVACFPAGPEGAHSVRNSSEEPVRVAMLSTRNEFGIAEYPDSDKVGVWAGDAHYMLRRGEHLDYWDGEPPVS